MGMAMRAELSPDGVYRYSLERWWVDRPVRLVLWVMLNPSIADARTDDATIRACLRLSTGWGYDGLAVVNLYALRSTSPAALATHPDPVGPDNDATIERWLAAPTVVDVVAAWGAHGAYRNRGLLVRRAIERAGRRPLCLGLTKGAQPRHPCRYAGAGVLAAL